MYYNGARPYAKEANPLTPAGVDPKCRIVAEGGGVFLHLTVGPELKQAATKLVTTELLGKATVSKLGYENPDGSPLTVDTDYFGAKRNAAAPVPAPSRIPARETSRSRSGEERKRCELHLLTRILLRLPEWRESGRINLMSRSNMVLLGKVRTMAILKTRTHNERGNRV